MMKFKEGKLTNDEMNILCIYQMGTRKQTIKSIKQMRRYLERDEAELKEMSGSLIEKLEQMSDEEFDEMDKFPDFDY